MNHAMLQELAAGAALDDLDAAERAEFEAHLTTCRGCQRLSSDLDAVLGDLALVAPELHPPRALQASVLDAIRGVGSGGSGLSMAAAGAPSMVGPRPIAVTTSAEAATFRPASRAPRLAVWGSLGLAAALGVVAVGLGLRTAQLTDEVAAANAAVLAAQSQVASRNAVMAVVADPGHVEATLEVEPMAEGATALVVFRPGSTESYLMANDLPATPPGQVYQLWFADDAGVHALGTFHHDGSGAVVAPFGVDLARSAAAMVTLEPEGGAQGEPGPQVVFGEF